MRPSDKVTEVVLFIVLYCAAGYVIWLLLLEWRSLLHFILHKNY